MPKHCPFNLQFMYAVWLYSTHLVVVIQPLLNLSISLFSFRF